MAFNIVLQTNNSEENRVTKQIVDIMTLTGVLREETSIIDPVIKIEADLADLAACNYLTIPAFNRSYFVRNIRSIRAGLVELTCHVDVLYSFRESLSKCTALVSKQENHWNLYLNDGTFKIYQDPDVLAKPFPSGFSTQEFVLAVAGS